MLMGSEAARCVDDPRAYAARYRTIVAHYEAEHREIYWRERRWPSAPFWNRRHRREPEDLTTVLPAEYVDVLPRPARSRTYRHAP